VSLGLVLIEIALLVGRGALPSGALVLVPLLAAALLGARIALPAPSLPAILRHLRVRHLLPGSFGSSDTSALGRVLINCRCPLCHTMLDVGEGPGADMGQQPLESTS
jgi:hypothetical protein